MVLGLGRKAQAGVGCYGKLPHHGDYVSHQCDGSGAQHLTAWLDGGYRLTGGQDDPEAAETWFVLSGQKRTTLYGASCPSGDASNTRRFPFTLFAEASTKGLAALEHLVPLGLAPTWRAMSGSFADLRGTTTIDGVRERLESIPLTEVPEPEVLTPDYRTAMRDARSTDVVRDTLHDVIRLARALPRGKKGGAPAFAIGCPLTTGIAPELEASFWLETVTLRFGSTSPAMESHIFIRRSRPEQPGMLFMIHRELRVEDLGFVLSPAEDYPYGNLLGGGADPSVAAVFRDRLREMAGETPTLHELLEVTPEL